MEKITEDNCRDCIMGREQYGVQWCPVHYSADADNARAIEQTGIGISAV
jgi:hypothetical protein